MSAWKDRPTDGGIDVEESGKVNLEQDSCVTREGKPVVDSASAADRGVGGPMSVSEPITFTLLLTVMSLWW